MGETSLNFPAMTVPGAQGLGRTLAVPDACEFTGGPVTLEQSDVGRKISGQATRFDDDSKDLTARFRLGRSLGWRVFGAGTRDATSEDFGDERPIIHARGFRDAGQIAVVWGKAG